MPGSGAAKAAGFSQRTPSLVRIHASDEIGPLRAAGIAAGNVRDGHAADGDRVRPVDRDVDRHPAARDAAHAPAAGPGPSNGSMYQRAVERMGRSVGFDPNSVLKSKVFDAVAASFDPCVVPSLREYDTGVRRSGRNGTAAWLIAARRSSPCRSR